MGPDREPAAIAYRIAQTARALNAATAKPDALRDTADARDVAEGLHLAVEQLPQALEQLAAGIRALEEQQALGDGGGPDGGASAALRGILNARQALGMACGELRGVSEALAGACGPVAGAV